MTMQGNPDKEIGVEVCLFPALFESREIRSNFITVVVDVLRATSTICSALNNGAINVIAVQDIEKARELKIDGHLVAGERGGKKIEFADFGNSPVEMEVGKIYGKSLVLTTTNGTEAIKIAEEADKIVILSFNNLNFVGNWLVEQKSDIVILCAGWFNTFSIEDAVCAGALVNCLIEKTNVLKLKDSAIAANSIWDNAKTDLNGFIKKGAHYNRLVEIGETNGLDQIFELDTSPVVPVVKDNYIINIRNNEKIN